MAERQDTANAVDRWLARRPEIPGRFRRRRSGERSTYIMGTIATYSAAIQAAFVAESLTLGLDNPWYIGGAVAAGVGLGAILNSVADRINRRLQEQELESIDELARLTIAVAQITRNRRLYPFIDQRD